MTTMYCCNIIVAWPGCWNGVRQESRSPKAFWLQHTYYCRLCTSSGSKILIPPSVTETSWFACYMCSWKWTAPCTMLDEHSIPKQECAFGNIIAVTTIWHRMFEFGDVPISKSSNYKFGHHHRMPVFFYYNTCFSSFHTNEENQWIVASLAVPDEQ
jgi:hypothetical protein